MKFKLIFIFLLLCNLKLCAQDYDRFEVVIDAYKRFEKEETQETVSILERNLTNPNLHKIFIPLIAVELNLHYLLYEKEKFNINQVNSLIKKYCQSTILLRDSNCIDLEVKILTYAAQLNQNAKNYQKQIDYLLILQDYYENFKHSFEEDHLRVLEDLTVSYFKLLDPKKGVDIGEKAKDLAKSLYGEKSEKCINSLKAIASNYSLMGNYKEAVQLLEKSIELKVDNNDAEFAELVFNLALNYEKIGNIKRSIEYYEKAAHVQKKVYGDKDLNYIVSLRSIALNYGNLGEFDKKIEILKITVPLLKAIFGDRNINYLTEIGNLAFTYYSTGDYLQAINLYEQVVDLRKEILGDRHPDYLTSLNYLAQCYSKLGNYNKALEINLKVVDLRKEVLGDRHPDYLVSLSNLASIYSDQGNYNKALEINQKVVELRKKILGDHHSVYLISLSNLAFTYSHIGDYKKALEINQNVVDLRKEILGDRHPDYLLSLGNLAVVYSNLGNYGKALEINQKVVDLRKEILGDRHPDYLVSLGILALAYSDIGDYKKSLEINQECVDLQKEILGDRHPDYLTSLNYLAQCYSKLGNYNKALEINLKVVDLRKELLGDHHPDYLASLNNLACYYNSYGDYQKALAVNLEVVSLRKNVLGDHNPEYLTSLSNLANNYSSMGEFQRALELDQEVVAIRKESLGELHPDYLISLNNLAGDYLELGNYTLAIKLNEETLDLRRSVFGENHPDVAISLINLAKCYHEIGNYELAIIYINRSIAIQNNIPGINLPLKATSLNNLANNYSHIGEFNKSLDLLKESLMIRGEVLGEDHPDFALTLNDLGIVYLELGDFKNGFASIRRALDITKKRSGENNLLHITCLCNLASCYSEAGFYDLAISTNELALEMRKSIFGENHPEYSKTLNNLANNYHESGDLNKALLLSERVLDIRMKTFGTEHPEYANALNNLAQIQSSLGNIKLSIKMEEEVILNKKLTANRKSSYLCSLAHFYFSDGNYSKALKYSSQSVLLSREDLIKNFSYMTDYQREKFWNANSLSFKRFPLYLEKVATKQSDSFGEAYDAALFSKGLLLNTNLNFDQLISEKGAPEAIAKFKELKMLKLQIQSLLEKPIAERYINVDSLENIAQKREINLVKISKEYGDYTQNMKINWKDVQSQLGKNDVAIEFVEYPTIKNDTTKYAALVLRKDWAYPRMIPLFFKEQMDEFTKLDVNKIYSKGYVSQQILNLLWKPLEGLIAPGDNVYFSAAGLLHQLSIESLSVDGEKSLGDIYNMHRLTSTKELVIKGKETPKKSAILYGGLTYNLEDSVMTNESSVYEKSLNLNAMRGIRRDTMVRSGWTYLPGTRKEIDMIDNQMKDHKYERKLFTGSKGNEESFKALSGKRNGILHIATHGFFLPIEDSKKNRFIMERTGEPTRITGIDPMLRAGLMLSGGNKAWKGDTIPKGVEDGVLTAKEIALMDLRGTDLVVLSACETGLGEVSGEGVFGLQRAFKQAGVQTIVMSLWEVNDEATNFMMTQFYSGLFAGKPKREAFTEAKKRCREKYIDPQYWAAFIMLD